MSNRGSLAFTFDHETSWTRRRVGPGVWGRGKYFAKQLINQFDCQYDFHYERGRGWGGRRGAENIFKIFQDYDVKGTWFCTGYALLTGNREKRIFAGNLKEPYATRENNWHRDFLWRATQGYFDEDPFTTWQENPEWYFGGQIVRLYCAGQDIQCHTFCHLYISLETPARLETDLREWQGAAQALGLPPANSLACPQESYLHLTHVPSGRIRPNPGRDLGAEWRAVVFGDDIRASLFDAGIRVLTRVPEWYWRQHYPAHRLATVGDRKPLVLFPGKTWKVLDAPAMAMGYIDEVCRTKGVGDLWCHPGNVLTRQQIRNFQQVVAYARKRAETGDLCVAPIRAIHQASQDVIMEGTTSGDSPAV